MFVIAGGDGGVAVWLVSFRSSSDIRFRFHETVSGRASSDAWRHREMNDRWVPTLQKIYPYIHGYFAASFFYILTSSVRYTFVSISRRNNEALAYIAMCVCTLLFRRFTDTNVYGTEPIPLKHGKLATKYPWICGYYYSATPRSATPTQIPRDVPLLLLLLSP